MTHPLVGVGIANAFFRKRIGKSAVPILALASNLPDIDAVVVLAGDPTAILMRRTFGHSLFLLPLWALALSLIFRPLSRGAVALGAVYILFCAVGRGQAQRLLVASSTRPAEFSYVFPEPLGPHR